MKQNIGSKTNKIQMISQIFFGQKILQRGSILNIKYAQFRFGNFGFGSVNLTEISVSVVSVFTRFGRPLNYTVICLSLSTPFYSISQLWSNFHCEGLRLGQFLNHYLHRRRTRGCSRCTPTFQSSGRPKRVNTETEITKTKLSIFNIQN